jgi:hypothetical protein
VVAFNLVLYQDVVEKAPVEPRHAEHMFPGSITQPVERFIKSLPYLLISSSRRGIPPPPAGAL